MSEETCINCKFWVDQNGHAKTDPVESEGFCRRFPAYVNRYAGDSCGEFKPLKSLAIRVSSHHSSRQKWAKECYRPVRDIFRDVLRRALLQFPPKPRARICLPSLSICRVVLGDSRYCDLESKEALLAKLDAFDFFTFDFSQIKMGAKSRQRLNEGIEIVKASRK